MEQAFVVDDPEVGPVALHLSVVGYKENASDSPPLAHLAQVEALTHGGLDPVVAYLLDRADRWMYGRVGSRDLPAAREYDALARDLLPRVALCTSPSAERHRDLVEWAQIYVGVNEPHRALAAGPKSPPTYRSWRRGDRLAVCTPSQWRETVDSARLAQPRVKAVAAEARLASDPSGWAAAALDEALLVARACRARQPELFAFLHALVDAYLA